MTATDHYDIVVVGGGINGAGIAQAAAVAGYRVLVLEAKAIASATSSRSSKLIHGGLRYLETGSFGLVRESLRERALLLKNAPGLVALKRFHFPIYEQASRPAWMVAAGLGLYAVLGGLGKTMRFQRIDRARWSSALDGLRTQGLQSVFAYYDAQTDDVALTHAVMESAQAFGADLLCPAEFKTAHIDAMGCQIRYTEAGQIRECLSHVLINAAGPWVNHVLRRVNPEPVMKDCELVQGTHLIVDMPVENCYYLEAPDRRGVFVLPWQGKALVGTTETIYTGDPAAVKPLDEEHDYLLGVVRDYFPAATGKVVDRFAGLRVLPGGQRAAHARSREIVLQMDNPDRPRLLTVYGGKLTVYRATAQKILAAVRPGLPSRKPVADTAELKLG